MSWMADDGGGASLRTGIGEEVVRRDYNIPSSICEEVGRLNGNWMMLRCLARLSTFAFMVGEVE